VIVGPLTSGVRFQSFTPVFGVPMHRDELARLTGAHEDEPARA
jgi:hypothetical protein